MLRPQPTSRHPVIIALFIMAVASGGVGLFLQASPSSVDQALIDPRAIFIWTCSLFFGGLSVLIGLLLQSPHAGPRRFGIGVSFEQVGMAMTGSAAILYAVAAYGAVGLSGAFPAGMTLVFGLGCIWREGSILWQIWTATKALEAEGAESDGQH